MSPKKSAIFLPNAGIWLCPQKVQRMLISFYYHSPTRLLMPLRSMCVMSVMPDRSSARVNLPQCLRSTVPPLARISLIMRMILPVKVPVEQLSKKVHGIEGWIMFPELDRVTGHRVTVLEPYRWLSFARDWIPLEPAYSQTHKYRLWRMIKEHGWKTGNNRRFKEAYQWCHNSNQNPPLSGSCDWLARQYRLKRTVKEHEFKYWYSKERAMKFTSDFGFSEFAKLKSRCSFEYTDVT